MKNLYWIIPLIIVCIGLGTLFRDNYLQITEPPSSNWSDALFIDTTTTKHLYTVDSKTTNQRIIPHIENDQVMLNQYSKDFSFIKDKSYKAKVDKGLKFYNKDNTFFYFSENTIYNKNHHKIHEGVDEFFSLTNNILFVKDNTLFQFDPEQEITTKLLSLGEKDILTDANSSPYVLTYKTNTKNTLIFDVYLIKANKTVLLTSFHAPMKQGQKVHDLSFTVKNDDIALSLQTEPKGVLGSHDFSTYFLTSKWSELADKELKEVKLTDPASEQLLSEVSNISPRFLEGKAHFLIQAMGYTQTLIKDNEGFNIYDVIISENNHSVVNRKSNTPSASLKPIWIDDSSIAWLEPEDKNYGIYVASSDDEIISKANTFNKDYFIRAIGKTMMGIVIASLMFLPSLIWVIWPILFIFLLHVFWGRFLDQQQQWIYYTGIGIYIIAAFIFQNVLFTETVNVNAPYYLTFTGSAYFYISIFALLSFISMRLSPHFKEWDVTFKVFYFVSVHLLMTITFYGPYLIGNPSFLSA